MKKSILLAALTLTAYTALCGCGKSESSYEPEIEMVAINKVTTSDTTDTAISSATTSTSTTGADKTDVIKVDIIETVPTKNTVVNTTTVQTSIVSIPKPMITSAIKRTTTTGHTTTATKSETTTTAVNTTTSIDTTTKPTTTTTTTVSTEKTIEQSSETTDSSVNSTDRQHLAEIVQHEAGSSWICTYDKAHIVSAVMNRVYDSRFPNTVYDVLTQSGQFSGFYIGSCSPTQDCYNAVDYYFSHSNEFDGSNSWYGNGKYNIFYYQ